MNINISKVFGQFAVNAQAWIPDEQIQKLVELGALYLFERQPSTAVEQKVFGPLLGWELTKGGKSYKRPTGFNRNKVEFSADLAAKVQAAYEATPAKIDSTTSLPFKITSIVQHVVEETNTRKMAEAFITQALAGPAKESLNVMLGLTPTATYADQVEKAHQMFFAKKKATVVSATEVPITVPTESEEEQNEDEAAE